MPLTTETAVRLILDTSLSSAQITQFIADADLWVQESLVQPYGALIESSCDPDETVPTLSAARLELIERYLVCALIRSTNDVDTVSVQFDTVREQYQRDPKVSEYLQRAASLDPTGTVRKAFLVNTTPVSWRVGRRFSHPRHN